GTYKIKNEKKIVEFMTEVIPRNNARVKFHCPTNLLDQFIYDETHFTLALYESERVDTYLVDLHVNGHLSGITIDQLWECISAKRAFIELPSKSVSKLKGSDTHHRHQKILILDLDKLTPVVQIFDEIGINVLNTHQ